MATVSGFRALRYETTVAGPLERLVAPPYDVIDAGARTELSGRSPYNVVHLTLPESPVAAAEALARWRGEGAVVEEPPALWWVAQDFVGPDGVARIREGVAGAIEVSPYAAGDVLPHERTHAEVKEGRLALLRATRTQLEPIFLLYDAEAPISQPDGEPQLEVRMDGERTRLWRLPASSVEIASPLLIADGHHRYETAVAFRAEDPRATRTFAVLVSTRAPGLEIFPTHRTATGVAVDPAGVLTSSWDPRSLTLYRDGAFYRLDGDDALDARAIERYGPEGVAYTPDAAQAIAAVDDERAALAFLVRPPSVRQVLEVASRGETMPQKSTYFYPKLTSGLLMAPL